MGFHEVQFPTGISYGSSGGPGFNTSIVATDAGTEERVARWNYPRHSYDASYAIRSLADLNLVLEFYTARQGPAFGFRYKDWFDFTSASDHRGAHDGQDVVIGTGNASEQDFQLIKKYTSGTTTRNRTITKPVSGTVRVTLDSVEQVSGWSVNTTSGIVTFTTAPGIGVEVTAGFEFDVPVRFGEELDEVFAINYQSFGHGSVPSIPLVEIVDPRHISDEFYFGGAKVFTVTADITITHLDGRVISVNPNAGSYKVKLPSEGGLSPGGPHFYIMNVSGSYAIDITEANGTTVVVNLAANSEAIIVLVRDSSNNIKWMAIT